MSMTLSRIGPLNQLDVYRIVYDFDRDHFKATKPRRETQAKRIIVFNQLERRLLSLFPIELVEKIVRHIFEDRPFVGKLLMYYKNTPALAERHLLPLSFNTNGINEVSRSLLVRLNHEPANGNIDSYNQLMQLVFSYHVEKLNVTQMTELLNRYQYPTLWDQAKDTLQSLSLKVRSAAIWVLQKRVVSESIFGFNTWVPKMLTYVCIVTLLPTLGLAFISEKGVRYLLNSAIFKIFIMGYLYACVLWVIVAIKSSLIFIISFFAGFGVHILLSLIVFPRAGLGYVLGIPSPFLCQMPKKVQILYNGSLFAGQALISPQASFQKLEDLLARLIENIRIAKCQSLNRSRLENVKVQWLQLTTKPPTN
jgi:hypothetical protein